MADADFLGVDKDEGTGTYRKLSLENTNTTGNGLVGSAGVSFRGSVLSFGSQVSKLRVPLDPILESLILALQVIAMYILVIGNRICDAQFKRIRTAFSECMRLVILILTNYMALRVVYKWLGLITQPQFEAWVIGDFRVTVNLAVLFVLVLATQELLNFGFCRTRARVQCELLYEVFHEERFFSCICFGFYCFLGLKLLYNIFK